MNLTHIASDSSPTSPTSARIHSICSHIFPTHTISFNPSSHSFNPRLPTSPSLFGVVPSLTSSSSLSFPVSSSSSLHSATVGFSDGEFYDKARPSYSSSVIDFLLSSSLSSRIQQSQLEWNHSPGAKDSTAPLTSTAVHCRPYPRICTTCLRRTCGGRSSPSSTASTSLTSPKRSTLSNSSASSSAKSVSSGISSRSRSRVSSLPLIRILELGAGTGKFSQVFYSRLQAFGGIPLLAQLHIPKNSNTPLRRYIASEDLLQRMNSEQTPRFFFELIVSEPMKGMREKLAKSFEKQPVAVTDWAAHTLPQNLPPTPSTCRCECPHECHQIARSELTEFDLIVAAQAIHWFSDAKSLASIHRNMHNQSILAVVFNSRQVHSSSSTSSLLPAPSAQWSDALEELTDSFYPADVPRHKSGRWLLDIQRSGLFSSSVIQQSFPAAVVQHGDEQMVVQRMLSSSVVAKKTMQEKKEIEKKIIETIRKAAPGIKQFAIEYRSDVYLFEVAPPATTLNNEKKKR